MPRTRPPYPPEFRAEAVRLVRTSGRLIREVASDLGISEQALRNWVRQGDLDDGLRSDGLTSSEQEELRQLRRRVRVVRQVAVGARPSRPGAHQPDPTDPHPQPRHLWRSQDPRRAAP